MCVMESGIFDKSYFGLVEFNVKDKWKFMNESDTVEIRKLDLHGPVSDAHQS